MRKYLLYILAALLLLSSCSSYSYTDTRFMMGTQCMITVYDRKDEAVLDGAFDIISDADQRLSRTIASSEISRINQSAGISPVQVSRETYELLKRAMELADATGYAFNPLIGGLTDLWAIGTDYARVPSEEEISALLPYTTAEHIVFDDAECSVFLTSESTSIDLGGIGKGYASDLVADYLHENGVERAIVNLGGNIYCIGSKSSKESWVVGLQNPDSDYYGGYYATVDVDDAAVITSGGYQRFTVEDGETYQHILDPSTGYPSDSDLLSASIISPDATAADALSTAVFVLGREEGTELVEAFSVRAVLLTDELEIVRL